MAIMAHDARRLANCDIKLIRARAKERGVLRAGAAARGIDTLSWKFTRILLATNDPAGADRGVAYEILHWARHLARPVPDTRPEDATR